MKLSKVSIAILTVSVLFSVLLTAFTLNAHYVASFIHEYNGKLMWSSTPGGSFLPWPKGPGMFMMFSSVNETDSPIYLYLIRSGLLAIVTLLLWTASSWQIWKLTRTLHEPTNH